MATTDINSFLNGAVDTNETTVLKSKFMSIISSLSVIDEEKECIKDVIDDLKDQHGIKPKIARAVAKVMKNPEKLDEMTAEQEAIQIIVDNLK